VPAPVLRLPRGEDLATISRSLSVAAVTLSVWRDAFLMAGEAALELAQVTARNWRASG
jgi:transposase